MEGRGTRTHTGARTEGRRGSQESSGGGSKSRRAGRREARGKRNQLLFALNVVRGKWRTEGWLDVMAPSTQPRFLPSGICSVSILPLHPSLIRLHIRLPLRLYRSIQETIDRSRKRFLHSRILLRFAECSLAFRTLVTSG